MNSQISSVLQEYSESYTTNDFVILSEREKVTAKFIGHYYRFENSDELTAYEKTGSDLIEWTQSSDNVELTVIHDYDPSIEGDGFHLAVNKDKRIIIRTKNLRGLRYAWELVRKIIVCSAGKVICPIVEVEQRCPVAIRGVIEGFYGRPWSHQDRIDVLHYLGHHRMNTYMYAPKDDSYQRKNWRQLYPIANQKNFKELHEVSQREKIDFFYMISPGNDIDLAQSEDIDALCRKLKQMIDLGFNHFGLLFDDIDYHLKEKAAIKYSSAASAHAALANQVNRFLRRYLIDYQLVVCPTEYDNAEDSPYLRELTEKMDTNIALFWTGPETLSAKISTNDLVKMVNIYQRPMIIWDNIPVNDFQNDSERIFLSPYENRTSQIANAENNVLGVVANPMAELQASKITLGTMAYFLWNPAKYDEERALDKVVAELIPADLQVPFKLFANFNQNRFTKIAYSLEYQEFLKNGSIVDLNNTIVDLADAADQLLQHVEQVPLLLEIKPWLVRAHKDLKLWQASQSNNLPVIQELQKALANYPYRIGTDLVGKYLQSKNDKN